jgi:hypothetical protein
MQRALLSGARGDRPRIFAAFHKGRKHLPLSMACARRFPAFAFAFVSGRGAPRALRPVWFI